MFEIRIRGKIKATCSEVEWSYASIHFRGTGIGCGEVALNLR